MNISCFVILLLFSYNNVSNAFTLQQQKQQKGHYGQSYVMNSIAMTRRRVHSNNNINNYNNNRKVSTTKLQQNQNKNTNENEESNNNKRNKKINATNRRSFLVNTASALCTTTTTATATIMMPSVATARAGLVQFPCADGELGNTYNFMRSGESLLEADNIWSTNPLFLTNREAALSERGIEQVERTCRALIAGGINPSSPMSPTIVRYSLAASTIDTANIVGRELKIGRDRLVPEFNFMDPRAVGKWDMLPLNTTQAAVFAMDNDEAGPYGKNGRPPANEDSTPHETLQDQAVRLRQLLSVLETQYSGDTVLLIFPDGTGPALLSALIAGIDLNRVHELEFQPSEIRLNVTMGNTLKVLQQKQESNIKERYQQTLQMGRTELNHLKNTSPEDIMNVKDQQLEQDRLEMEAQQLEKQLEKQKLEETIKAEQRERMKQIEQERQRKRDAIANERKQKQQQMMTTKSNDSSTTTATTTNPQEQSQSPISVILGSLGALGVGALSLAKSSETDNDNADTSNRNNTIVTTTKEINGTTPQNETTISTTIDESMVVEMANMNRTNDGLSQRTNVTTTSTRTDENDNEAPQKSIPLMTNNNGETRINDGVISSGKSGKETTTTISLPTSINLDISSSSSRDTMNAAAADSTGDTALLKAKQAMNNYLDEDDGGEAWLQSLNEIIDESDNGK